MIRFLASLRLRVTGPGAEFEWPREGERSLALTSRLEEVVTAFRHDGTHVDLRAVRRFEVTGRERATPVRVVCRDGGCSGSAIELRWVRNKKS